MTEGPTRQVDLLVVGAGPAGCSAALAGARAGLSTLLVERVEVGLPVRCGEYVPAALSRELPAGALSEVQRIARLVLHLPDGDREEIAAPGATIDRDRLDRALAEAAIAAGAELRVRTPLVGLDRGGRAELGGAGSPRVRARVVVGADGPRSVVGRAAGLGRPRAMLAIQARVPLAREVASAHFHFRRSCRHGYGWLFPKGEVANLGVALPRSEGAAARRALHELAEELVRAGVIAGAVPAGAVRAGLVPSGGPVPRLGAGRVLLAGDAAGQADALTGAGIVAAIRGGTLAGEAAAEALADGRPGRAVEVYEARWRRTLGLAAARGVDRRNELEALWDRDPARAVRRAWLVRSGGFGRSSED